MINTNKNIIYLILILTNIFFINSFSQISTNELPLSILDSTLRLNELEELDSKIIYETFDSLKGDNNQILINQFGNSIETNVNIENSGIWRNLESGGRIWSLIIECTQAKSINLIFDKYWLPKGAKLFIYNPETKYSIGAFTEENNLGTHSSPSGFATRLLPNNKIYIELFEPENIDNASIISISNIIYGVKCSPLISDLGCYGESGECHVNINCSEGNVVRDYQAKGVASVLTNNGKCWLTGSLLNNTNYDGTLYFLTAEHGIYGSGGNLEIGDTAKWLFLWNFVSSTCAGTLNNNPPSTYGAILVSVNDDTDMALLRLIEPPQKVLPNGVVFYNGWDRKLTQNSSGVMIHHPKGDVMKIATFNVAPSMSGNFWRVSSFISTLNGYSIPEGGSSGAPVFNNKMQVIGNHYSSSSANCSDPIQEFSRSGAIGISWDNGTIPSEILQPWLDPFDIDLISIDGEFLYTCGRPTYVYNVTVNSTRTDYGCIIISKNTTVNSSGLTFDAEKFTILESNFEVKSGAIFEINTH